MRLTLLTHFFTFYRALGGIESMLQRHWRNDRAKGLQSQVLAFFESPDSLPERVSGLGLTWRDSVISMRRKFRRKIAGLETGLAVYHNAWGMPLVADLDQATRRVSMLHSDLPILDQLLESQRGIVDGVLCVSEPLRSRALAAHPELTPDRIAVAPIPIATPPNLAEQAPLRNRPIVCGFSGRVVRAQKRVERLPMLCRALREARIDYRFEILGDGPDREWLQTQFAADDPVLFHKRKEGAEYWRVLSSWDAIVFVSDYEGLPISLLEAMSAGVIPIFPKINTGGDAYAASIRPEFLYEDRSDLPAIIRGIVNRPPDEIDQMRRRCRELAAPHQGDAYECAFATFVKQIEALPKISAGNLSRPFYPSDLCPFGLMRRVYNTGFFKPPTQRPT